MILRYGAGKRQFAGKTTDKNGMHLMPKFVIERDCRSRRPSADQLSRDFRKKSCNVLQTTRPANSVARQSYVTAADKIYCIYIAPSEELIREHARQGGFPANRISEVVSIIDPTTAEAG